MRSISFSHSREQLQRLASNRITVDRARQLPLPELHQGQHCDTGCDIIASNACFVLGHKDTPRNFALAGCVTSRDARRPTRVSP